MDRVKRSPVVECLHTLCPPSFPKWCPEFPLFPVPPFPPLFSCLSATCPLALFFLPFFPSLLLLCFSCPSHQPCRFLCHRWHLRAKPKPPTQKPPPNHLAPRCGGQPQSQRSPTRPSPGKDLSIQQPLPRLNQVRPVHSLPTQTPPRQRHDGTATRSMTQSELPTMSQHPYPPPGNDRFDRGGLPDSPTSPTPRAP